MSINIVLNQLVFMSSFVEDLLNLRLLQEGSLELVKEPFNIVETLEFVLDMF